MPTKSELRQNLVELGLKYNPVLWPFPNMKLNASREKLAARIQWMQKALDMKQTDEYMAYLLFSAAWNGFLDPTIAAKAGIQ